MIIKKIKRTKEGRIVAAYELHNSFGGLDTYTLESAERAAESLDTAFDRLAKHVVSMCELPEEYTERVKVTGVTFNHNDEGVGAVITAQMKLKTSNAPLNLNTPYKHEAEDLPFECFQALLVLATETELYIRGNRAQMSLFNEFDSIANHVDAISKPIKSKGDNDVWAAI